MKRFFLVFPILACLISSAPAIAEDDKPDCVCNEKIDGYNVVIESNDCQKACANHGGVKEILYPNPHSKAACLPMSLALSGH